MADALPEEAIDSAVKPSQVARQKFDLERRGFDQAQVRSYLVAVADALRDAQNREAEIRTRLGKAVGRAERAEATLRDHAPDDPAELTRQLGDEVTAVLDAARIAGEQKVAVAEKSAEQLLTNAKAEANTIRQAAETIMDERRAKADAVASELLAEREAEAQKLVETARRDAETLRSDAAADIARVRDECDALIREAEEARTQILLDMERRRRQARAQVERLRVGRDRLLRSYEVVRRTLDESTAELKGSLKEAKVLGDTAARRVASEPAADPDQLEAEIADARLIGRAPTADPGRSSIGSAGGAPKATKVTDAGTGNPGAKSAESAKTGGSGVPAVEMPVGPFSAEAAPTPKRPVVGDPTVPKPPAVAPQIKTPEADSDSSQGDGSGAGTTEAIPGDSRSAVAPEPTKGDDQPGAGESDATATKIEPTAGAEPSAGPTGTDVGTVGGAPLVIDVPSVDLSATRHDAADAELKVVGTTEATRSDSDADAASVDEAAEDFSDLPEAELDIVEPNDEIEQVVALDPGDPAAEPDEVATDEPASSLFAALRAQAEPAGEPAAAGADTGGEPEANPSVEVTGTIDEATDAERLVAEQAEELAADLARQREAVIAELCVDLEKRLKRALADEQNDVLAGIRSAERKRVELVELVGDPDAHVQRYVVAINEVAAAAYAAGAALVDGQAGDGAMPAGAVEEILGSAVVLPIRLRLIELDSLNVESAAVHVESIRAFYRQRKTDHLGDAAETIAGLLVTAGACDVLPADSAIPWLASTR